MIMFVLAPENVCLKMEPKENKEGSWNVVCFSNIHCVRGSDTMMCRSGLILYRHGVLSS